eukprot:NODE_2756_length_745_cov_128.625000_g1937_i0.p3 GENE.NODE_2756_length_745_cov_128.625000_g1937_i0~~NODE_2756_length_745_cov_128.625000_g1937_i0.p3  ORF type:complete len:88 (-),score=38.40 NODE_2756_length_745_cov_128.625000_g1937_i0:349-612(-)
MGPRKKKKKKKKKKKHTEPGGLAGPRFEGRTKGLKRSQEEEEEGWAPEGREAEEEDGPLDSGGTTFVPTAMLSISFPSAPLVGGFST